MVVVGDEQLLKETKERKTFAIYSWSIFLAIFSEMVRYPISDPGLADYIGTSCQQ
jgi:hypothetical protein